MTLEVSVAIHCRMKLEPMNPAPPVTRIVSACMLDWFATTEHYHAFFWNGAGALSGGTGRVRDIGSGMSLSASIWTILVLARPSHFGGIWRDWRKAICC